MTNFFRLLRRIRFYRFGFREQSHTWCDGMYLHIFVALTSVLTTLLRTFHRQISMSAHKILKVEQKWIPHIVMGGVEGGGRRTESASTDSQFIRFLLSLLMFVAIARTHKIIPNRYDNEINSNLFKYTWNRILRMLFRLSVLPQPIKLSVYFRCRSDCFCF